MSKEKTMKGNESLKGMEKVFMSIITMENTIKSTKDIFNFIIRN